MRLKHPSAALVLQAMEDSFNPRQIEAILFRQLGQKTYSIFGAGLPWPNQVNEIYQEFDSHNTIENLLTVLRDARPNVPEFAFALDELGFAQIKGPGQAGRLALEALLARKQEPFQNVV